MKIVDKREKPLTFGELEPGDVFKWVPCEFEGATVVDRALCMKMAGRHLYVQLCNGAWQDAPDLAGAPVQLLDCELHILGGAA